METSDDNYSSISSSSYSRRSVGCTFSEFATPTTPISSPSFEDSIASSSVPSGSYLFPGTEETYFEDSSEASLPIEETSVSFSETELSFVETTVNSILSCEDALKLPEEVKVAIFDGFQEFGIFEADAGRQNNSFAVYNEILSRIAFKVQRDVEELEWKESRLSCYAPVDTYVDLTVILVHLSSLCGQDCGDKKKTQEKYEKTLMFINRLLTTLGTHMNKLNNADDSSSSPECSSEFPSLAYYRFVKELMKQLVSGLKSIASEIVSTFCIFLHDVSPKSIPIFAFQWLSIIGSGEFLGQVLDSKHPELEVLYSHHLLLLLDYLKPLLITCQEQSRAKSLMEYVYGITRLLLIIHHDFPDFFIRHGFQFIEFVPISNVQLRCIILSTIPTYIVPTSPLIMGAFVPNCLDNLEMDLAMLGNNPELDYHEWCLRQCGVLSVLVEYLEERKPMGFLLELRELLGNDDSMNPHPTARWKEPELRAIICYTAAAHMRTLDWNWHSLPTFESLGECSFMDIYQILALALDENGRALFFSLVVDRLRYPCLETYYFFMVLARLFTTLKNQIVKEQLVTALMQRILAYPPHQWGVLAAFSEFIQNPVYNFWSQPFLRRHPSTTLLFDTVSRTWRRQYET